jgi:hypothetical protein
MDLPFEAALAAEFARGVAAVAAEGVVGAEAFAGGAGRHGGAR